MEKKNWNLLSLWGLGAASGHHSVSDLRWQFSKSLDGFGCAEACIAGRI